MTKKNNKIPDGWVETPVDYSPFVAFGKQIYVGKTFLDERYTKNKGLPSYQVKDFPQRLGAVLSLARTEKFYDSNEVAVPHHWEPLSKWDYLDETDLPNIIRAVKFISEHEDVYVHCTHGHNRSCIVYLFSQLKDDFFEIDELLELAKRFYESRGIPFNQLVFNKFCDLSLDIRAEYAVDYMRKYEYSHKPHQQLRSIHANVANRDRCVSEHLQEAYLVVDVSNIQL